MTDPVSTTKHHDVLWVSMMLLGYGMVFTIGAIQPFLADNKLVYLILGILAVSGVVAAVVGATAVGYRTFKLTNRRAVVEFASIGGAVKIEYVDGLFSFGGHRHAFIWWENPPRLVMDSALLDQPTLRDFTIWHFRVLLRIMRRKSTGMRWLLMYGFFMGVQFGVIFAWWILASRRP